MGTTFAGDPVNLKAPEHLRQHYAQFYPDIADSVFAWLHSFPDSNLTGGDHVKPLFAKAVRTGPIDRFALLSCIVMANHNQEEWLHSRMTFHALADIQELSRDSAVLRDFCTTLRPGRLLKDEP